MILAFSGKSQYALRAQKHLEKGNLEQVIKMVERSIRKSPTDPANYFILAQYYIHPDFGFDALDSANQYEELAKGGWNALEEKEQKKYARKGMDSSTLVSLSLKIDSLAFANAALLNTEKGYNHFIQTYEFASQKEQAIEARNEVAYKDAVSKNSAEAMEQFFRNYPEAKQAKKARGLYETLYYEKFTSMGTLESFQRYLTEKPESTLKDDAAFRILEIISTGIDSALLQNFISKYPETRAATTAGNLLQYWDHSNLQSPLLLHYKSGDYYFFDIQKQKLLDFTLASVEMDSCASISSAIIATKNKSEWYDRAGNLLVDGPVEKVEYLQSGFYKVQYPTKAFLSLYHVSKDSALTHSAEDFRHVDAFFLSKRVGQKWQLMSLLGEEILAQPVDSIWTENNLYFFQNNDRMAISNKAALSKSGKQDLKTLSLLYTDYKIYDNGSIWLESNDYQSVLSADLTPAIPLKKVSISKIPLGWVVQDGDELSLLTNDFKSSISLNAQAYKANSQMIALKNDRKWALISSGNSFPEFAYDSVRLFNSWLTYTETADKRELLFSNRRRIILEEGAYFKILKTYNEEVLKNEGQVHFLEIVNKKGYSQIFNGFGTKIAEGEDVKVDVMTSEILQISSNRKKYLVDSAGNKLFNDKIDAFGNMQNGLIPILKNKKFGAFQISNKQLIPFKSEVKIQVFVPGSLFVFQEDGSYGIMDASGQVVLDSKFQSIRYLNDSLAFVEIENGQQLININTEEVLLEGIKILEKLSYPNQEFYLIRLESGYGIINNAAQELLPFIFNAIEPITFNKILMWKAERRISEMDYQVIAYYNVKGELLFREGFTNEEYLKTTCD